MDHASVQPTKQSKRALMASVFVAISVVFQSVFVFAGTTLHFKSGDVGVETQNRLMQEHLVSMQKLSAKKSKAFFIVQFRSAIHDEDRQNLLTLGAQIVRYIPDDALVVKATHQVAITLTKSSLNVETVVPFQAAWKTSTLFEPASVFSKSTRGPILIQLFPGETSGAIVAAIAKMPGAKVISSSDRALVVELSRSQVEAVASLDGVEYLEPAPHIQSFVMRGLANETNESGVSAQANGDYSDLTGFESGTKLINADAAYARGLTGRDQIVSMADTGLDSGDPNTIHQDFKTHVANGFSFGLFAKSWDDPMGHGTHVAGSVMGSGAASGGKLRGGAFEAQMVPEGMWSPMMDNLTVPSKLGDLFTKAYGQGARIHTNSWGSPQNLGAYDGMASQVDEFMAANPEMLILFAAGNSGVDANKDGRVDANSIGSPATAKNVLTVGASKNYVLNGGLQIKLSETKLKDSWPVEPLASSRLSEDAHGLAAFSSRGPTTDGRLKPDVVAPGTNILSVHSQVPKAEALWGLYNNDYAWSGGTSMATPVAAGGATLVRQYLVESRKIARPSAALIKAVLMHTATDMFPGQFGAIGASRGQEILTQRPNVDEGYGRVDLDKATDLGSAILVDEKTGLSTGETHTYPVRVSTNAKLVATLVYTDAAGSATAAKALVNDLDLVLVDPSGRETSLSDHINNSELIQADVSNGAYTIKVTGANVPQGPASGKQPYALVLSLY